MISKTLDELIKKYPNRDRFYSLERHKHLIIGYKIDRTTIEAIPLYFGTSIKELFELVNQNCLIDYVSEKGEYYFDLCIMTISGITNSGSYNHKVRSNSKYNMDLKLNKRIWYCYNNKYLVDNYLALKIIDEMYEGVKFSTEEYDIEVGNKVNNIIKATHKRMKTSFYMDAMKFTEHHLMRQLKSIYAYKLK